MKEKLWQLFLEESKLPVSLIFRMSYTCFRACAMVFKDAKTESVFVVFWRSRLLDDRKFKVVPNTVSKFDLDTKHGVTNF